MARTRSETSPEMDIAADENQQRDERASKDETAEADRVPTNDSRQTPNSEGVSKRAYEIYCERGCEDGHDLDDWLRAEREVKGQTE